MVVSVLATDAGLMELMTPMLG